MSDRRPRTSVLRGSLTVVVIKVPLSADGRDAVHKDSEPLALPTVEILHLEALAALSPLFELNVVTEELVVRQRFNALACP